MTGEHEGEALDSLDELVGRLTAGTHSDDEALRAFRQALADRVAIPCDAFVTNEPVSVTAFDHYGNPYVEAVRRDLARHVRIRPTIRASDTHPQHSSFRNARLTVHVIQSEATGQSWKCFRASR